MLVPPNTGCNGHNLPELPSHLTLRLEMTRRLIMIATSAGLLMAGIIGFFGWNEMFRIEVKNGPASTIGRSGDFKSPGGTTEESERRRLKMRPGYEAASN